MVDLHEVETEVKLTRDFRGRFKSIFSKISPGRWWGFEEYISCSAAAGRLSAVLIMAAEVIEGFFFLGLEFSSLVCQNRMK